MSYVRLGGKVVPLEGTDTGSISLGQDILPRGIQAQVVLPSTPSGYLGLAPSRYAEGESIATGIIEWPFDGGYQPRGARIYVASTSDADVHKPYEEKKAKVWGIDTSGNVRSEEFELNGTTSVESAYDDWDYLCGMEAIGEREGYVEAYYVSGGNYTVARIYPGEDSFGLIRVDPPLVIGSLSVKITLSANPDTDSNILIVGKDIFGNEVTDVLTVTTAETEAEGAKAFYQVEKIFTCGNQSVVTKPDFELFVGALTPDGAWALLSPGGTWEAAGTLVSARYLNYVVLASDQTTPTTAGANDRLLLELFG